MADQALTPDSPTTPKDIQSTTPPPLPGHPPALNRMATTGNVPLKGDQEDFDIVDTYHRLLREDSDLTMPVAAIEALILYLSHFRASTIMETLDNLDQQSNYLKSRVANPISLSAGTDLFQRYILTSLKTSGESNFDIVRQHLLSNGRLFVSRAKAARERIANYGRHFVRDGSTVLTHGGSRVVATLLAKAADTSASGGSVRFKVIYVMPEKSHEESQAAVALLRSKGVPIAIIPEGAVAYSMPKVDFVMVGAEGVVENGGIISRLGTYQIGLLAKSSKKPFYVVTEKHKFVRLFPLGQYDLPIEQNIINFTTDDESAPTKSGTEDYFNKVSAMSSVGPMDPVDFTPPEVITALITESGSMTTSAVSEELISIYY